MDARPVKSDSVQKAPPSIEISPLSYKYVRSPSNVDSNLLVLLHGLGDTHLPFLKLGESLQKTLPQTAVLALRAGTPIPLLMGIGQEAWCWWETFDMLGQGESIPFAGSSDGGSAGAPGDQRSPIPIRVNFYRHLQGFSSILSHLKIKAVAAGTPAQFISLASLKERARRWKAPSSGRSVLCIAGKRRTTSKSSAVS